MIETVREIVKSECKQRDWNDWEYHIKFVVKHSKFLAEKLNADKEVVELAALLHDIGRVKFGPKDHEITGSSEAEKILKQLNYPQNVIGEVKHCIETHRTGKNIERKTLAAEIIANADAMAHYDAFPFMIKAGLNKNKGDLEKAIDWVYKKMERDWKDLTLPVVREMMNDKHEAIKLLLNSVRAQG